MSKRVLVWACGLALAGVAGGVAWGADAAAPEGAAAAAAAAAAATQGAVLQPGQTVKTASGLTITEEPGDPSVGAAKDGDTVWVHYRGSLQANGQQFDSSYDRKEPIQFVLGEGKVIKGWEEGLKGMHVGDKRRLIIPPELAYGEKGRGPIPANSTLVFDVELVRLSQASAPQTLPSGLIIIPEGSNPTAGAAKPGDTVVVNYTGRLKSNGEKFDSSYDRKEPFRFTLGQGQVIKGWDEGIKGMRPGDKRKLIIPPDLGYGAAGSPPKIPGGATLEFDVEMLKVEASG